MSDQANDKKDTGTAELLAGGALGVYGAGTLITAGAICPTCVIFAPALLAWGGYKKYKSLKGNTPNSPLKKQDEAVSDS